MFMKRLRALRSVYVAFTSSTKRLRGVYEALTRRLRGTSARREGRAYEAHLRGAFTKRSRAVHKRREDRKRRVRLRSDYEGVYEVLWSIYEAMKQI